jgi:signal transduction histidine kinase
LRAALAEALDDPDLNVMYWLPDAQRYVDTFGRPADPHPDGGRAVTTISRRGEPLAVVVHDRPLYAGDEFERQIGSAVRLAIDNERLRAEVLAKLEDLRSSRARIVVAADAARRQLERDLHDGAQQRLLAASYELRLADAAAQSNGDEELATLLASAIEEVRSALAELREFAHGIFPAILDEAGLAAALWTLADCAPLPVAVTDVPEERLPAAAEGAAYLVVTTALDAAAGGPGGPGLRATVCRDREMLSVQIDGACDANCTHLADRVGALGGRLTFESGCLRAEIPCA